MGDVRMLLALFPKEEQEKAPQSREDEVAYVTLTKWEVIGGSWPHQIGKQSQNSASRDCELARSICKLLDDISFQLTRTIASWQCSSQRPAASSQREPTSMSCRGRQAAKNPHE